MLVGRDHHLAGVHTEAKIHSRPVDRLGSLVDLVHSLDHGDGRRERPIDIVLVRCRDAEDGHHGIAEELAHPTGPHGLFAQRREHDLEHFSQWFDVELLSETGSTHHVGEEHRHEFALGSTGHSQSSISGPGASQERMEHQVGRAGPFGGPDPSRRNSLPSIPGDTQRSPVPCPL